MLFYALYSALTALYCAAYIVYCIKNGRGRAVAGAILLTLVSAAAVLLCRERYIIFLY